MFWPKIIFYFGYVRETSFVNSVKNNLDYCCLFFQEPNNVVSYLNYAEALVFIGKQHSNFPNIQDYFNLIKIAHTLKIPVIAILENDVILPKNNKNIDLVIQRQGRYQRNHAKISDDLESFIENY